MTTPMARPHAATENDIPDNHYRPILHFYKSRWNYRQRVQQDIGEAELTLRAAARGC